MPGFGGLVLCTSTGSGGGGWRGRVCVVKVKAERSAGAGGDVKGKTARAVVGMVESLFGPRLPGPLVL